MTRDSIIIWAINTYHRLKEEYNNLFENKIYSEKLLKVSSPTELKKIISSVKKLSS